MRIEQWLCNARFFKSRGLAQTAVDSGRVKVNGERSKSGTALAVGDQLNIQIGEYSWDVKVLSVTEYAHGFVPEPHELYEEDEDALARRAQAMEAKKLQAIERAHPSADRGGRQREGRGERPGGGDRQPRGNAPAGRKNRHRRKRSRGGGGGGGGGGPDRRSGGRPA